MESLNIHFANSSYDQDLYEIETVEKTLPLTRLAPYHIKPDYAKMCKECPNYNMVWSCPPYDFCQEELFNNFDQIIVVCKKIIFQPKAFVRYNTKELALEFLQSLQYEKKQELDKKILEMERNYSNSKAFLCGRCCNCDQCARAFGLSCRNKIYQRPSMEALGFDIGRITKHIFGFPLLWFNNKLPAYLTFIAALLVKED